MSLATIIRPGHIVKAANIKMIQFTLALLVTAIGLSLPSRAEDLPSSPVGETGFVLKAQETLLAKLDAGTLRDTIAISPISKYVAYEVAKDSKNFVCFAGKYYPAKASTLPVRTKSMKRA